MNEKAPEVSAIIPCYNGERFVSGAIESVLKQTRGDVEVVVVDDGSADGSVAVVERHLSDRRVKLIRHETNRGIAAARNTGIRNATGRYIGFLDQDDLWCANKLSLQLERFEKDKRGTIGVVFSELNIVGEGNDARPRRGRKIPANVDRLEPSDLLAQILLADFIHIDTVIVRRECFETVGLLNEDIRSGSDDFDLFTRLARRYRFACVHEPLVIRKEHETSYTDPEKMAPDALKIIDALVDEIPALRRIEGTARSRCLYSWARALHAKGKCAQAVAVYKDAIRARPLYSKPWFALILCRSGRLGDAVLRSINRLRRAIG